MNKKTAIIIGAGPAGLTAAYELLQKTNIKPIIFEMTDEIGGICRTVNYKGNRMDIGGHRFFTKSDRIMHWWLNIYPIQGSPAKDDVVLGRKLPIPESENVSDPEKIDKVMLFRKRLSRIFYLRRFFDYPVSLSFSTIFNLGLVRIIKISLSYIKIRLFPIRKEKTLDDFMINRFGKQLYLIFFKDYTQKVWGVSPDRIKPEWGVQRIKGVSMGRVILHALNKMFKEDTSISQEKTETSLIEYFIYPKYGPGHFWQEVAEIIKAKGGEIYLNHKVIGLGFQNSNITEIEVNDKKGNEIKTIKGDYFFSTMPIKELIWALGEDVPEDVRKTAEGLVYRSLITVGLLIKKLKIKNETAIKTINNIIPDLWIYIQEKEVKIGRLQIFNNWSPYLVKDDNTVWTGLEYFCDEGDELWSKADEEFAQFAIDELAKIDIINKDDVLDYKVVRHPKTYPAYFGGYENFAVIRGYIDRFENLFLIGRNGMHRYNNMDHSMLSAMTAVDNIVEGRRDKSNIWSVNI